MVTIKSFGGPIVWFMRKHFSKFTSALMLSVVDYLYQPSIRRYIRFFESKENDPPAPLFIDIETINRCNGSCAFCPANIKDEKRPFKKMDEDVFFLIINQLKDLSWTGTVYLNINNEPMIDKRIPRFVEVIKKQLKDVKVSLITNGTLMTEETLKELFDAGLDDLCINNYSTQYRLTDHNRYLYRFIKEYDTFKIHTKVEFRRRYINEILATRAGSAPNKKEKNNHISSPCLYPFVDMVIFPDGKVGLCCNDCYEVTEFGDLKKESIMEIWRSEKLQSVRKHIARGRINYNFCKDCDVSDAGERERSVRNFLSSQKNSLC